MAETEPFGAFSKLPPELRIQIWEYVLEDCDTAPATNDINTMTTKPNSTASTTKSTRWRKQLGICSVMRLNRAISEEFGSIMYDNQCLRFTIQPDSPEWAPSSVIVEVGKRWRTKISHSYFATCGYDAETKEILDHFSHAPYHRFKSIAIDIVAPDPEDQGELLVLWNQVTWLAKFLGARQVPKVRVQFLEEEGRSWHREGVLNESFRVPREEIFMNGFLDITTEIPIKSDLELLILPLIHRGLSDNICWSTEKDFPGFLLHDMSVWRAKDPSCMDEFEVEYEEERWLIYLDLILDELEGKAADKLRLERYSTWSDEYFWKMWDLIAGTEAPSPLPLSTSYWRVSDGAPASIAYCSDRLNRRSYLQFQEDIFARRAFFDLCERLYHVQWYNKLCPLETMKTYKELTAQINKTANRTAADQSPLGLDSHRQATEAMESELQQVEDSLVRREIRWDPQNWWNVYGDGFGPLIGRSVGDVHGCHPQGSVLRLEPYSTMEFYFHGWDRIRGVVSWCGVCSICTSGGISPEIVPS